ncbi:MAG: biotin--[acetyl-CoA-carboxylase] ligase [Candidatus Bathyarchaeota archaeon]|nr:biotin--[acetyl-CoA-carboxylase] ligase [Candidatus Bathyarchaeota archaeon]
METEHNKTKAIGQKIHYYGEVTSTNDVAKELAKSGVQEGTAILAATQTHGKGRRDRRWLSPTGGLWLSIILRPKLPARDSYQLTFMAAVAVAKTLRNLLKLNAEIKWPNDILVNERKVCGILTETSTSGTTVNFAVVGIGVNTNIDLTSFPKELRASVTSLKAELKRPVAQDHLLRMLLKELETYYTMLQQNQFEPILDEWKRLTTLFGAHVEVTSLEETIQGVAVGVNQHGALEVLLQNGTLKKIVTGDVIKQERQP